MKYFIRALTERPETDTSGVVTWGWADHAGWHQEAALPDLVPTGDAWGWAPNRWLYWRDEIGDRGVGCELVQAETEPGESWVETVPDVHAGAKLPMVVSEKHLLATEPAELAGKLRAGTVRVLTISTPTQLTLFSVDL